MRESPPNKGLFTRLRVASRKGMRHMKDSLESRSPGAPAAHAADGAAGTRRIAGTIRLKPGGDRAATPELPHERDQEAGTTGDVPSESVQQAYRDLKRGLVDTDRGVEAGRTYQKLKR